MRWPSVALDELKAHIPYAFVGGPFGSNLTTRDYVEDGVPVIRGQNLIGPGLFDESDFVFVSEDKAEKLRPNTAFRGDLLFTQRGTLGQVGLIPEHSAYEKYIVSQSQMKLTVDRERVDPRFIYYYFRLPETVEQIKGRAISAGVPHINLGILKEIEVPLPPKAVQTSIATMGERYDDLIETNRRRIALLEESARLLYREWFVKLRFPGHEGVKKVDGVPAGWESKPLSQLVDANPKTSFEKDRVYPFIPMQSLSETSMAIGEQEQRAISGGAKFQNGDTLLARITPCLENGKTGFVQFLSEDAPAASGSTEFIVLRSKSVNPYWVYCLARDETFREHAIRSMAGADGRQRVNPKCFDQFMALQPPNGVLLAFEQLMQPAFKQVEQLNIHNRVLQQARDALLPKLMSGQLTL